MTIADEARDSALHCEMVKYALRQNKDGVVVSFVVHPNDIPAALSTSHIGSRFMVVLVQIGDDERPIPPARKAVVQNQLADRSPSPEHNARPLPDTDKPSAGAKRDWRDVSPAQQAGIRCDDPVFIAFIKTEYAEDWREFGSAADVVRTWCNVASRSELNENHKARALWHQLDSQYQGWLAKERIGA